MNESILTAETHHRVRFSRLAKTSVSVGLLCVGMLATTMAEANPSYITATGSWSQGQSNATQLVPWNTNYCYLTRVSGRYAGDGEQVQVYNDSTGFWYVGGTSQQHDVTASANCFTYSALQAEPRFCLPPPGGNCRTGGVYIGGPFSINTGGESPCSNPFFCTQITPAPESTNTWNGDAATILSGITGEFNGGGELVQVVQAGTAAGFNTLSARAGSFNGVGGWAQTLFVGVIASGFLPAFYGPDGQFVSANAAGVYSASSSAGHGPDVVQMALTSEAVCYFTAIGGAFAGSGEYAQITAQTYPDGEHWVLEVGSQQGNGTNASARCYALNQTVSR